MSAPLVKPKISLRAALDDPELLGTALKGPSWHAWRSLLLAAVGEPLVSGELDAFRRFTGRDEAPTSRCDELWCAIGRRGGKSRAMAVLAVYIATFYDYRQVLARGETGVVLLIAPDKKQASVLLGYAQGVLESTPMMSQLIANRTADTLTLTNGVTIEVRAASFRKIRGVTCVAVLADEVAFWLSEEFGQPRHRDPERGSPLIGNNARTADCH